MIDERRAAAAVAGTHSSSDLTSARRPATAGSSLRPDCLTHDDGEEHDGASADDSDSDDEGEDHEDPSCSDD